MWTPHAELHGAPCGGQRGIVDKDLHKLIVRQWQEPRAALMYILQGRFVAPLAAVEVAHMPRRVVNPTSQVVSMLTSLSKIDIEVFGPPVTEGSVAVPRQPEVHFHTFTTAWVMLLDVGGEDGGALSQARRLITTTELKKMAEDLSSYMREHYNTLIYKEAAVRRRVMHAANRDTLEFVGEIADMARELRRKYPSSPPPEGEGGTANPPRLTLLRELIGRSSASLLGRMDTGLDVPGYGSGPGLANKKRKVVTSKVADNNSNGRSKSSWGLVRTIAAKNIARQACVYSASGRACPRNDCSYERQQLGDPPPPPPLPFLPLSRNRCSNSSSRSGASERLPPLQAPGTEGRRGLAITIQDVERRTLGGGEVGGADRATEPLVDVVRGVRDDGKGESWSGDHFSFLGSTHVGGTGRRAPSWFGIAGSLFR